MKQSEPIVPHLGLLLIDLQPPFLADVAKGEYCLQRCQFALAVAELFGLPMALTEQMPEKLGATDARLFAGPAGTSIGKDAPVFAKASFSAIGDDAVAEWIEASDIQHLLIAGLETHICVYQTALDALNQDFGVTVLADAVSSRHPEHSALVFDALRDAEAHILPAETVFYSLLGSAAHPAFRSYNSLVKGFGK